MSETFVTCACSHCEQNIEFDATDVDASGIEVHCPHCHKLTRIFAPWHKNRVTKPIFQSLPPGFEFRSVLPKPQLASIQEIKSGSGFATILQIIGALILIPSALVIVVGIVGLILDKSTDLGTKTAGMAIMAGSLIPIAIGIAIHRWGSRLSVKTVCGKCGNRIDGKQVLICPTCRAEFG